MAQKVATHFRADRHCYDAGVEKVKRRRKRRSLFLQDGSGWISEVGASLAAGDVPKSERPSIGLSHYNWVREQMTPCVVNEN